jgi:glycosyltransferase involved in cell wall biosynthesis
MKKHILFFGFFDPDYSRNQVLITGFKDAGCSVEVCGLNPKGSKRLGKYWRLWRLARHLKQSPDLVLVAYPGQISIWLAFCLFGRKRLIFDAFTSLYDSNVFDRQLYSASSWRGRRDYYLDYFSARLCHYALTDTTANADYWAETFKLPRSKFVPVWVGTILVKDFQPWPVLDKAGHFLVHFHGTYIPLQGIETIIQAAKLLESETDITFRIIGSGQMSLQVEALVRQLGLSNVEFLGRMSFVDLVAKMSEADLVLGIFGQTPKAGRVIPNKVFEGLALAKPVLTADTPAIRELLTPDENVCLCPAGEPEALAAKIKSLKDDPTLLAKVAAGGKKLVLEKLQPERLVTQLLADLSL